MRVKKRDGHEEEVRFDKVKRRLTLLCEDLKNVDIDEISQMVISRIYNGVTTTELDELAAQMCSSMVTDHPDYGELASRIAVSNHQKNTSPSFSEVIGQLYNACDSNNKRNSLISDELYTIVNTHKEKINDVIRYERDFLIDYFGFKTLERSYLLKIDGRVVERPQHMFMRVALGIHGSDFKDALETYDMMSQKMFVHATPTLFNAGTPRPQLASCFLQAMKGDSIEGIFDTLKTCALISKYSGGVGLHVHDIRGKGGYIRGTNGKSNGIIPMLNVYNKTALYVDQCFRGDTHVYTDKGATKIERVKVGDKVLTSDGSFKSVLKTIKNDVTKPTLRVRTNNAIDTVYLTKEHQVYALQEMPSLPISDLREYLIENEKKRPKYIEAKKLNTFDYIGYPIPDFNDDEPYEDDICRVTGIVCGNGRIDDDEITVSFYRDKGSKSRKFLVNFLNENGVKPEEYIDKNFNNVKWRVTENTEPIKDFLKLNKENSMTFLAGMLDANGCVINTSYNCMFYNTQQKHIGYYLRYMFMKFGMLVDGFYRAEHKHYVICIPYCQTLYDVMQYTDNKSDDTHLNYFEWGGIIWTGIKSIDEMKDFKGYVYDLNIEDNHNYVTEMGIVHNSGKRNGNFAIYLEPTHPDILNFIDLRKNHGNEAERCRDLFTALWIPDLFMKRVKEDGDWCLFCPDKTPGLSDVYGEEYEKLYLRYEEEGLYMKKMKAQEIWKEVCVSNKETGTPYICFKDSVNKKSNQKNIGVIKSSNLCAEVMLYSDDKETAVCNLASIALPSYVDNKTFNFEKLYKSARVVCKNLNKVIDRTFYPVEECERSNKRHRPIGIGVSGLADCYMMLDMPFDSEDARLLNRQIFETIYYGAIEMSMELAKKYGEYDTFENSPAYNGDLQFDLWNVTPDNGMQYDWDLLKHDIQGHGLRNSVVVALMPTASTSQIMGVSECFEPLTTNIYSRRTLSGEFIIINKFLIEKLIDMGLWSKSMKNRIIESNGSVQGIDEIPREIREVYKTAYEIGSKAIIDQMADRGPYVDQSASMNLFMFEPEINQISNAYFYSWKKGLKTGQYYCRTAQVAKSSKFSQEAKKLSEECLSCSA